MKEEITRIKNVLSYLPSWVKVNRTDNTSNTVVFDNDNLNRIPRVGRGLVKKLVDNIIT